jgi:hypothetical protein
MPKRLNKGVLASIIDIGRRTDGPPTIDFAKVLKDVPQRTLQYWLKSLVADGRLVREGKGPAWRRASAPPKANWSHEASPVKSQTCSLYKTRKMHNGRCTCARYPQSLRVFRNIHRPQTVKFQVALIWRHGLSGSEADRLAELSRAGICPNCGTSIQEGTAVVRGPGSFCSLECVALFHHAEFSERARRLEAASRN